MEARFSSGIPRPVEAGLGLAALVVLSPVLAVVGVAVRLSSPGPVLFRQTRMGRDARSFTLLKFRTMRVHDAGLRITTGGDSRVTSVGAVLRRTKIDELPELWNLVRGDISLVGSRPEVPEYVDPGDPLWRGVLAVRPGITDPVTLELRNEEDLLERVEGDRDAFYREVLLPYKLRGNLRYLENRSCASDVTVILRTLWAIVVPGRAQAPTAEDVRRAAGLSV